MYNVLIVEDELLMRQGLLSMLDWKHLGMKVESAANGKEALTTISHKRPEILITDLRMPNMDGIELIEEIRKTDSTMRIIILTCLDDFALMQRALALGVTDYILKLTADIEEIEGILIKISDGLDAELETENFKQQPNHQLLQEQIFRDYICCSILTSERFSELVGNLSMHLPEINLCIVRIALPADNLPVREGISMEKVQVFLLGLINGILTLYGVGKVFCGLDGSTVIVFGFGEMAKVEADELRVKIITEAERSVRHYLGASAHFGFSGFGNGYEILPALYKEAGEALSYNLNISCHPKLSAVMSFLREKYTCNISLQDAADFVGVTPNYLSRIFLQSGLGSFTALLNEMRVLRAKTLLRSSSCAVYRVGEQVGFPNATYFIRVFKKYTGITPNEYRSMPREEWE